MLSAWAGLSAGVIRSTAPRFVRTSQRAALHSLARPATVCRHAILQRVPTSSSFSVGRHRFYSSVKNKLQMDGNTFVVRRHDNIIKSVEDAREYRGLELSNGLRVLLVSDEKADKAAAALDVNCGHLMDRWEMPGTAHFCEHMLFLGTDKYPLENEYGKFITSHAGSTNAFTASDHTNYHFDVAPAHLNDALDRFVQFFLTPQFTESATDREVNAVNSEHQNNLQSDPWRQLQIERSLSTPGHDYGKFGTGDRKTLWDDAKEKGLETREELLKFHKQWYSSNIMTCVVVGKDSLDAMEAALGTLGFDAIENKAVERKQWSHPYKEEDLGRRVEIVPVKDVRHMTLSFPMPDLTAEFRSQPAHYISHLLGHEGKGSLLSELKSRGWVTSLSSGYYKVARGFGNFTVTVDLSPEGIEHTDEIVELVFAYIGMLKRAGPQEWIQNELKELGNLKFTFKDKERPISLATALASELQDVPFEHVLSSHYLISDFQPDRITDILATLVPERMTWTTVGKKFAGQEGNSNEPIYGTEHRVRKIDEPLLSRFSSAMSTEHASLHLPEHNAYIPTRFDLRERDPAASAHPRIVRDDAWSRVWFKQDDEYKLPKMITKIGVSAPIVQSDPRSTILSAMFVMCLQDALGEETYNPHLAGLSSGVDISAAGIDIRVKDVHRPPHPSTHYRQALRFAVALTVRGYDEKQRLYVRDLVNRLANFKPDPLRFEVLKETLRRQFKNFEQGQPYSLSQHFAMLILAEKHWSKKQLLAVSEHLTTNDVIRFIPDLLRAFHVEILVHGNSTEKEALSIADEVVGELKAVSEGVRPLFSNEIKLMREHDLGNGKDLIYRHQQETHAQSCVDVIFQTGVQETRANALLELTVQLLQEPAFDQLRTKESLGYIVHTGARRVAGQQALEMIVQGPQSSEHVDERIENFLLESRDRIAGLSDDEFKKQVEALATKRLEKPKTLSARFARYWTEIESKQYNFNRSELEVAALRGLTKDDVLSFYDKKIASGGTERKKLAIYIHSKEDDPEQIRTKRIAKGGERTEVVEIDRVRAGLSLYPNAASLLDIPPAGAPVDGSEKEQADELRAKY